MTQPGKRKRGGAKRVREIRIGEWVSVSVKVTGFHGDEYLVVRGSGLDGTVLRSECWSEEPYVTTIRQPRREKGTGRR